MPITDSVSQLIEGVTFVFGRLCSCHSVIATGGQFSWNWGKVAVNRDLLNVARAVWFPVFCTCHRPHRVSGVRGPGNGSLFFRWIAYVIYSGSCLIPLRRLPSATAIISYPRRGLCESLLVTGSSGLYNTVCIQPDRYDLDSSTGTARSLYSHEIATWLVGIKSPVIITTLLALNMLDCFKDYIRHIHMLNRILDVAWP